METLTQWGKGSCWIACICFMKQKHRISTLNGVLMRQVYMGMFDTNKW